MLTSSFMILFTIVVLPALSSPLPRYQKGNSAIPPASITHSIRILISLSFKRAFLSIDNIF